MQRRHSNNKQLHHYLKQSPPCPCGAKPHTNCKVAELYWTSTTKKHIATIAALVSKFSRLILLGMMSNSKL